MSMREWIRRLFGGKSRAGGNGSGAPAMDAPMISCQDALATLYEFLDGELDQVSHDEVKAHFDVCQRCYPHLRLEESFRAAVHRACAGEGAPPELRDRLKALLAEAEQG